MRCLLPPSEQRAAYGWGWKQNEWGQCLDGKEGCGTGWGWDIVDGDGVPTVEKSMATVGDGVNKVSPCTPLAQKPSF